MFPQEIGFNPCNWRLTGFIRIRKEGRIVDEDINEFFFNKEDAEKRKLYWKSIPEQHENKTIEVFVYLEDLAEARERKFKAMERAARAAAWKPIDYEALRIDPYTLEVKKSSHKMIITYLETNKNGTQVITTEEKELNGSITEAIKEFEKIAVITRDTKLSVKEEGTDKRIINMEFKSSFNWGGKQYPLEEENVDWYNLDYVKELSYWNGEEGYCDESDFL